MTVFLGDNIISALGFTSAENFENVKNGASGLKFFADRYDLPEPFMASEIDDVRLNETFETCRSEFYAKTRGAGEGNTEFDEDNYGLQGESSPAIVNYTKLEKACIVSIAEALKDTVKKDVAVEEIAAKSISVEGVAVGGTARKDAEIDLSSERVLFILSTTKGNVFLLDENERYGYEHNQLYLWRSAELIAQFFGNTNKPLVVSNACISGAFALMAAQRELRSGRYDYVIVTGADMLSKFIVTGFQSFKALSLDVCKPFDANRNGLNIGEAAATLIMTERGSNKPEEKDTGDIVMTAGAVRNDANHISGPSRTGEGSYLALCKILEDVDIDELAFVCAHGTATPYNDEMESISITRAGLQGVLVNSLKGYFGHTLGAAGILESVISMCAIKEGIIPGTYGFETLGVTNPLHMVKEVEVTNKRRFVKMLSGFGGCNVAMLFTKY